MAIKAITVDLFGTVVDWRGTIIREGKKLGLPDVNWEKFARTWASKYSNLFHKEKTWKPLEEFLRQAGEETLAEFGINLNKQEKEYFVTLWSRLTPWNDIKEGLPKLREKVEIAILSNANFELSKKIADNSGMVWDYIFGADDVKAFKPDLRVYEMAIDRLGWEASEVMMVAAHLFDLEAAKKVGMRTAFVHREREERDDPSQCKFVDLIVKDFIELSEVVGKGNRVI